MVNDQLPLETLIRKIEQFSGPNNIAKMKSDEVSRSEVVNFVQQKQKESAERNSRKVYSKDNPNNSQNSFPPISNRLITLCSELNISEKEMRKRLDSKVCLGCAASSHFYQECYLNPNKKSNNHGRKVSKKVNPRDDRESEYDSENSVESVKQKSKSSNFFSNKKQSRISMIRLPKASDTEVGQGLIPKQESKL